MNAEKVTQAKSVIAAMMEMDTTGKTLIRFVKIANVVHMAA